ncbi:alkaline phosphatase D family protein [soil metagenome]
MLDFRQLPAAVRSEGGLSRRLFLAWGASLASLPLLGTQASANNRRVSFKNNPFSLGIASGDPLPTGVVLWTRLAPSPLEPSGGMPADTVDVKWEIAEDEAMTKIVRSGVANAMPQLAHSVHVEVDSLEPDRWYWYRFHAGDATSAIGRTRTAPLLTTMPERLRFAFASCSHWEQGLFTAYQHLAKEELDLIVHLGDYIYEYAGIDKRVRKHHGGKIKSLSDYRVRHAEYKTDEHLQAAHLRCPWVVTWDDHEFENNYANDISQFKGMDPVEFLKQRTNAYQAYYEHMPLRAMSVPKGPDMKLYRTLSYGRLTTFQVLDTRQYRTDQPNGDKPSELNAAALDPKNTLLGKVQREWLQEAMVKSTGVWNVLAQQVMMGLVGRITPPETRPKYSMDQWPSAATERMQLAQFIADKRIANPVVLTGDIHSNWVNELRVDDRKPETPIVAAEFVGTSISSGGNGVAEIKGLDKLLADNPCVKFHNRQRGYVSCTVTPKLWTSDFRIVENVVTPGGPVKTLKSFVVEAGRPGVKPA